MVNGLDVGIEIVRSIEITSHIVAMPNATLEQRVLPYAVGTSSNGQWDVILIFNTLIDVTGRAQKLSWLDNWA